MRKEISVTIDIEGRDKGKVFHIREMSAARVEKWALRAISILARSGVDLPTGITPGSGVAGVAAIGLQALMRVDVTEAEPLLDEMFECISIQPDHKNPNLKRFLVEDDIEEISTRFQLRMEVFNLHTGFSVAGQQSKPALGTAPTQPGLSSTKISRARSPR